MMCKPAIDKLATVSEQRWGSIVVRRGKDTTRTLSLVSVERVRSLLRVKVPQRNRVSVKYMKTRYHQRFTDTIN